MRTLKHQTMNISENHGILEDHEYETLFASLTLAGVDLEGEVAMKAIKEFEKAAVSISILGLLTKGLIEIAGVDEDTGDIKFKSVVDVAALTDLQEAETNDELFDFSDNEDDSNESPDPRLW